MASDPPTSIRFPEEVLDYYSKVSEVLKESGLNIKSSRNDVICMVSRHHINRVNKMGSNELFEIIYDNLENPSKVDAYTVRGIIREITKKDMNENEFNRILGVL